MKSQLSNYFRCTKVVLLIFSATVLLGACSSTSTLSTRASQIRLINALQAHHVESRCEFLGNVTGIHPYNSCCLFGFTLYGSYWNYNDYALNHLLDNAAELGATHVFVNMGNGLEMRGEAYLCAQCIDSEGMADEDYCLDSEGKPEMDFCMDNEGNRIGSAQCQGADGDTPEKCRANRGKWIPGIQQAQCEAKGNAWVNKSADSKTCVSRGGVWRLRAKDQVSCQSKGGVWVVDEDVLKNALSPVRGQKNSGSGAGPGAGSEPVQRSRQIPQPK
jgi:hypothetical protein